MLIDDVKIVVEAGRGGKGAVNFNSTKMSLGPVGGSGGRGGSVFLEGVSDLGALAKFRHKKTFKGENGRDGRGQFRDGYDGKDVVLSVPVGTVIRNLEKETTQEVSQNGERVLIAKGGRGGRGNFLFRSAKNTSPEEFEEGKPGEKVELQLELKLIADVGFVGLPNVGKSSLLNELTNASAKVANYQFTTLEPNLGVYYSLILADIPGLIEGASTGKGLGIKFLKHVERTRILLHFVSAIAEDPLQDYNTIRKEMEKHNPQLLQKPEYIILSQADMADEKTLLIKKIQLETLGKTVTTLSLIDEASIASVKKILNDIMEEKKEVSLRVEENV